MTSKLAGLSDRKTDKPMDWLNDCQEADRQVDRQTDWQTDRWVNWQAAWLDDLNDGVHGKMKNIQITLWITSYHLIQKYSD